MEDNKMVKHHKILTHKFVGTIGEFKEYLDSIKNAAIDGGYEYSPKIDDITILYDSEGYEDERR